MHKKIVFQHTELLGAGLEMAVPDHGCTFKPRDFTVFRGAGGGAAHFVHNATEYLHKAAHKERIVPSFPISVELSGGFLFSGLVRGKDFFFFT